ncbi:MAG: formylglycine-generating enzyme family protein [Bryobacteraceae bacterium]|nr:formylglycine-generating enzyme family protein [Bryobacteraceae bacterium]
MPEEARYEALLNHIRPIFERGQAAKIELADRVAAAEALGQAGDWRFAGDGEERWVTIPAGTFLMGAQSKRKGKPRHDEKARENEGPVREVTLGAFQMGRYPVTVGEYARFVDDEDRGYGRPASWRHGWIPDGPVPRNSDEQVEFPNRPVVYVNWYEATAYCEWAGVRLPSEEAWEYAARGTEGRRYPWGRDEPDLSRASYGYELRSAFPVGLFPDGATPEGIEDMAGNVWEWRRATTITR